MQGLRRNSVLFLGPREGRSRQPLLILSFLLRTPEKAGMRLPLLILSPFSRDSLE